MDAEKINPLMALSPPDCEPTLLSLRVKAPSVFTFNVRKARLTLPEISGNPAPLCAPATKLSPGAQFRKNLWPLRNLRPELGFWGCRKSFRNWALASGKNAGTWGRDEIRDITGTFGIDYSGIKAISGAFSYTGAQSSTNNNNGSTRKDTVRFSAASVVPTGQENVPPMSGSRL